MSYTTIIYDMSLIVPGGRPDAQLTINIFQEQDAYKNVVFEWRDIDYIPITDTDLNLTDPRINPSTLNAYDLDNDGNLLLSFRNHSDIMKISRETGDIMWRWGGLKNEFTFFNEHPENAPYYFARQHHIRRLSNGNVSIFDNGEFHTPWYSRAAEYQLDEINKTATLVSEYRYSPGNISTQAAGNADPLSDGGWFVGYGILFPTSPVKRNIVEVHGDGSIAFELSLPNNVIAYRVSKQPMERIDPKDKSKQRGSSTGQHLSI
ncbi:MAG: aryl-sulfate sulfotransferase [Ignavibacteriales bacterium]|nr:aryl-sulfate sulfotransferase [Ignavibacteriales bacterium]